MKTRQELIDAGKIWQVYPSHDNDIILFEGNKTAVKRYIKNNNLEKAYKTGMVRMGKLIWEKTE